MDALSGPACLSQTAIAGVRGDRDRLASEIADLLYHTLVLMAANDLPADDVWRELNSRRR